MEDRNQTLAVGTRDFREGGVRVVHHDGEVEHELRTYGEGDHIGELAVLREAPRAATVIAQAPKMAPHISAMCSRLASDLRGLGTTANTEVNPC